MEEQERRMEINLTAIERNLRLYGVPGTVTALGVLGTLLIDPHPVNHAPLMMLAPLARGLFVASAVAAGVGAIWVGYRAVLEWRWERGTLNGGCLDCGGLMRHLDGRYSAYSKCLMCGAKREGWH